MNSFFNSYLCGPVRQPVWIIYVKITKVLVRTFEFNSRSIVISAAGSSDAQHSLIHTAAK